MNINSAFAAMFTFGKIAMSLLLFAGSSGAAPSEDWNRTFGSGTGLSEVMGNGLILFSR